MRARARARAWARLRARAMFFAACTGWEHGVEFEEGGNEGDGRLSGLHGLTRFGAWSTPQPGDVAWEELSADATSSVLASADNERDLLSLLSVG